MNTFVVLVDLASSNHHEFIWGVYSNIVRAQLEVDKIYEGCRTIGTSAEVRIEIHVIEG